MTTLSPFYVYSTAGYVIYINKLAYSKVLTTVDNHWIYKPLGSVGTIETIDS